MSQDAIDPYSVGALESSVNDSATRVSAIWISFLIFGLYLLIAAATVSQRQLLLAEPVKLPVLNIDLPLWGFFFLAPILFVTLHIYVLLQVLLLGRTTAAYESALAHAALTPTENAMMRQRLANTLFAQIFAGSPRERSGFVGTLLQAIVWVTLAAAPLAILLTFQFSFLAYHSHLATWTHRVLIFVEIGSFFMIWPMALNSRKDFSLRNVRSGAARIFAWPTTWAVLFLWPAVRRRWGFDWPRHRPTKVQRHHRLQLVSTATCGVIALASLVLGSFPGEPHINALAGRPLGSVHCSRWLQQLAGTLDLRFDRLVIPEVDIFSDERLAKLIEHGSWDSQISEIDDQSQNLSNRDLNCGVFTRGDLRYVNFTGAKLREANFDGALLEGAILSDAHLEGADLSDSILPGARLVGTYLQGANLAKAALQSARLSQAKLHGADLRGAQLQNADLGSAFLYGTNLEYAQMQAAKLYSANISFASLKRAELQGSKFISTNFRYADLSGAGLWQAQSFNCKGTMVENARFKPETREAPISFLFPMNRETTSLATAEDIKTFLRGKTAGIAKPQTRSNIEKSVMDALTAPTANLAKIWTDCDKPTDDETDVDAPPASKTGKLTREQFQDGMIDGLRNLVCRDSTNGALIARRIVESKARYSFLSFFSFDQYGADDANFMRRLARAILADGLRTCDSAVDFDDDTMRTLQRRAAERLSPVRQPPRSLLPLFRPEKTPN